MATLAIDASLYCSGYAVMGRDATLLSLGRHFTTRCKKTPEEEDRIFDIYTFFDSLIEAIPYIDRVAMEAQYVGKNAKTSMILSRVRGSLIILCKLRGLSLVLYEPSEIKKCICGDGKGNADKFAVYEGIRALYAEEDLVNELLPAGGCVDAHNKAKNDDISDALAVAHTDLLQRKLVMSG